MLVVVTVAICASVTRPAHGQSMRDDMSDRRPQFLLASNTRSAPVRIDVARTPVLRRRIAVNFDGVTMEEALRAISRQAGLQLAYSKGVVPLDRKVRLSANDITVAAALTEVLLDADVDVLFSSAGDAVLVRRSSTEKAVAAPAGSVIGRVTDSTSGLSVSRAQVSVGGSKLAASTNDDGRYYIAGVAPGEHQVTVRRIGYEPASKSVQVAEGATATVDFALRPAATQLQSIVTTVTGQQQRYELGNVIGTIAADSVVRTEPVPTLVDVLNGRVSGLQVMYNGGVSGFSSRIRIRGQNSFTLLNDPLLVVDGVRMDNGAGTGNFLAPASGTYGWTSGRLNDLNPEEIESIEVVKGPSAATLYGTNAANGVIVVRTKRGAAGPARWSAYTEAGRLDAPGKMVPSYFSWGHTPTGTTTQCLLPAKAAGLCTIDSLTSWSPFNNAETTPLGLGSRSQIGLQVSSGVNRFRYFVSGEIERETGPLEMPAAEQRRISAERGGVAIPEQQIRPNSWRKISLRSSGATELGSNADINITTGLISNYSRIPGATIFASGVWNAGYRDANDGWTRERPGEQFALMGSEDVLHSTSSLNSNWHPIDWLQTHATAGLDFSSAFIDGLQRRGEGPLGAARNGRRFNQRSNIALYTVDLGATATRSIRETITSRSSVGLQYNRRNQFTTNVTGTGLPPGSVTVAGATVVTGAEATDQSVVAGSYIEQSLGWMDRLYVTGAVRADGGSSFGRNFKTAVYPKASVSWLAINGGNSRFGSWLPNARLRAAYGASGVQPSSIAALARVTLINVFVDGTPASGAQLTSLGNPNLKPERSSELETGVDVDGWNDRAHVEATYYLRRSNDALVNRPLGLSTGLGTRQENLGAVENRGFEGQLRVRLLDFQPLSWDLTLNGSVNRNRLLQLAPGVFVSANQGARNIPGYPINSLWARPILGFSDVNGDGILTDAEVTVGDTMVFYGSLVPTRTLGISNAFAFLNNRIRLGSQIDYRGGYKQVNFVHLNSCGTQGRCRGANDPRASLAEQAASIGVRSVPYGKTYAGDIGDGTYARWREVSVTYLASQSLAHGLHATSATLTFAGRNLAIWSRLPKGIDPEATDLPNYFADYNVIDPGAPMTRYFTLRLNLGF